MRIGLFYESELRSLIERIETALERLGHDVVVDYQHQSEIDRLGWVVVMNRLFSSCDGMIGVQAMSGIVDDKWRGIKEEQSLFSMLHKPNATVYADTLSDDSDDLLMQQCDTLVEYLRYRGAKG